MSPIRLLVGWGIFRLKKEVIIGGADPMKTTFVGRVTQKPNKTRAFEGCYEEPEIPGKMNSAAIARFLMVLFMGLSPWTSSPALRGLAEGDLEAGAVGGSLARLGVVTVEDDLAREPVGGLLHIGRAKRLRRIDDDLVAGCTDDLAIPTEPHMVGRGR